MNISYFWNKTVTARFLAAVTIVSMILSAFPAAFFVAQAQAPASVNICKANQSLGSFVEGVKTVNENAIQEGLANSGKNGDIVEDGQNWDFVYASGFTGEEIFNADCVNEIKGSIKGSKYNDNDNDGSIDGEDGIEDWVIRLYEVDTPWVLVGITTTDENGGYEFNDLQEGQYKVCEVMQADWTQTFVSNGTANESPNSSEEGPECRTVNIDDLADHNNTVNFGNYYEEPVDFCDPSQKPGGIDIAEWHEDNDFDGSSCFEYEVVQECGGLDAQFTLNETGLGYGFHYVLGTETPVDFEDGTSLPVSFDEDENGGSVELTYYVVGQESDFFTGSDVPNFWDGTGVTVTVDTDCEKEEPKQCVNLLTNGSFEEPVVTNGSLWQKFASVTGWLIQKVSDDSATTLELHRGWSGNAAAQGEQYAELDGDHSTKVSQTVATQAGGEYELSWAFAPRHNIASEQNQLSVLINGSEVTTEGPATAAAGLLPGDWTQDSYVFTATGEMTDITFADAGPSNSFGTFLDDARLCLVKEPEKTATVHAEKIVCTDEADLPNWGTGGPNITETTAADWISEDHPSCELVEGWEFEWAPKGTSDPGDILVGPAGGNWTTFTGSTEVPMSELEGNIWMREVLQDGYLAFTHGPEGNKNTNDVSAEFYCHTDVLNYDNYDRIDNPEAGENYYCVAWNVPDQMCSLEAVSDTGTVIVESNEYAVETYEHPNWTATIPGASWIWEAFNVLNPEQYETKTFRETFEADGIKNAFLEVAADNTYKIFVNGNLVVDETSENNFTAISQDSIELTSYIIDGSNTLDIEVTNKGVPNSTPQSNPAGVLYKLVVNAETECKLTTYVDDTPEYAPYCGDQEINQDWEQCEVGEEGCTEYCLFDNQCSYEQLVKITLDENAPESVSFDNTLHLGAAGNMIPNGTWFNFNEVGDDTYVATANAVDGLAIQRDVVNSKLGLAFVGGNGSRQLDYVQGNIMTLGVDLGAVDRAPNPSFKLENSEPAFVDIFSKTDENIDFDLRADTGNDGVTVEVGVGEKFNCEDCKAEVEARVVLQDGEEIFNGGDGNLKPQVILGDGSVVDFGEWFPISVAPGEGLSAEWIDDPETVTNFTNPADLDGLFVSREGDGTVKVALYGFHNPGGDTNYESLRATIEFNDATILGGATEQIAGDYKLENHSETDGVNSNDNFDSLDELDDLSGVDFDLWVDTKADGFTITLGEVDYCEDDSDPEDKEHKIEGYKHELGDDYIGFVPGWTINLVDAETDEVVMSTTTDENGYYYFYVGEGEWEVHEVLQDGWSQVYASSGVEEEYYPDEELAYCEFSFMYEEGLEEGDYYCDFYNERDREVDPELTRIDGHKFEIVDDGDPVPYDGWTIYAFNNDDETLLSTQTDQNGYYYFDVEPGDWEISEEILSGWVQVEVYQNGGLVSTDADVEICTFLFEEQSQEAFTFVQEYESEEGNTCDFYNEQEDTVVVTEERRRGGGGGGTRRTQGPTPQVLGATTQCNFLIDHMQMGIPNDRFEVQKLQLFLSMVMGYEQPITGFFGTITDANVKRFQETYRSEILDPWFNLGIVPHNDPTGFVYKLTKWKINDIVCPGWDPYPTFDGENLQSNIDIDVAPIPD